MNENENIITIEDEIKEFSDKPVKSSAIFKALEEKGVPDSSEASVGDALALDENKKPIWTTPGGGGGDFDVIDFNNATIVYNGDDVTVPGIYNMVSSLSFQNPVLIKNVNLQSAPGYTVNRIPFWADNITITNQGGVDLYTIHASIRQTKNNLQAVDINIYNDVVYW